MIIAHAYMQIQPDKEPVFLEEIRTLIQETRPEAGNIGYELMKSTERDDLYTMVEVWKDLEAASAHMASDHFTSFFQKAPAFMAAPLELKVFDGEPIQVEIP